jgi:hypothetical protein
VFGARMRAARRQEFVATYRLPSGIGRKLQRKLGESTDIGIAFRGLHQWLRLHVAAPGLLAMPSKAVDQLWHEFILHTRDYQDFCRQAYGRTLHHSPEESMNTTTREALYGDGIARTFAMACADEGIRLPQMLGLPTLFQVDTALALPDAQRWVLDCGHSDCSAISPTHCVRHQVRPFIPKHLPLQRDPITGQWLLPKSQKFSMGGGNMSAGAGWSSNGPTCGGHG